MYVGKNLSRFLGRGCATLGMFKGVSPNQLATIISREVVFGMVGEISWVLDVLSTTLSDLCFMWICKGCTNSKPKSEVDLIRGLEVSSVLGPPSSANLIDEVSLHNS